MNGFALALLVGIALLAVVFLWKNQAARKKSTVSKAEEQAQRPALPPEQEPPQAVEAPAAAPVPEESAATVITPELPSLKTTVAPTSDTTAAVAEPTPTEPPAAVEPTTEDQEKGEAAEPLAIVEHDRLAEETEPVLAAATEGEQEAINEQKVVAAAESVSPSGAPFPEEGKGRAESPASGQLQTEVMDFAIPDLVAEPKASEEPPPLVRLSLEAYASRLNALEERQRAALAQAIEQQDDKRRDQLQRELVIMNDKLALLADSYVDEMACYQQILDALVRLRHENGEPELTAAIDQLQVGEPAAAEAYLAHLSGQSHPLAAQAAHFSGQLAECRVDLQQAMERYRLAVAKEPGNPRHLQSAGRTARCLYKYKEAVPWLESFVQLSKESSATDPLALALAQRELAYTYVLSGQYQKAGPLYKESMTSLAKQLGQDHVEMAVSWRQIGEYQETLGEYDKAVALYKKALDILEKKRGREHPALTGILAKLAALCMELEMEKQAVPLYERLVRIQEKTLRPTHPQLVISLNNLAESYRLQGQYAEAEACYRKSLAINEAVHGKEHPSVAAILQELAKLCTNQRKSEEAQHYQQRAAAIFQQSVEAAEKQQGKEALTLEL